MTPSVLAERLTVTVAVPVAGFVRRHSSVRTLVELTALPTNVSDAAPYVTVETVWLLLLRSDTPTRSSRLFPEPTVCDHERVLVAVSAEFTGHAAPAASNKTRVGSGVGVLVAVFVGVAVFVAV